MSSTEGSKRLAAELFTEIAACAERLRKEGKSTLALGPDPAAATYFEAPARRAQRSLEDFAMPGDGSPAALVHALCAQWRAEGLHELADMEAKLLDLCSTLAEETTTESDDVSPFVYAMF